MIKDGWKSNINHYQLNSTKTLRVKRLPDTHFLEIPVNKATICLTEFELLNGLPKKLFERGLKRWYNKKWTIK